MKQIPLSQGLFADVDDADFENLNRHKWFAFKARDTYYAARHSLLGSMILMHREVMKAGRGVQIDHKDHNGLNNTQGNLRIGTHAQNQHNRGKSKVNTTGYKGVTVSKKGKPFQAQIRHNGKHIYLGMFDVAEDAASAYDKAARELHGEFANTNF
jgi:hypothetical protein